MSAGDAQHREVLTAPELPGELAVAARIVVVLASVALLIGLLLRLALGPPWLPAVLIPAGVLFVGLSIWLGPMGRVDRRVITLRDGVLELYHWRALARPPLRETIRRIPVSDVRDLSVVDCVPYVDGEWTTPSGRAVRIVLLDGDDVRVGSERPEELLAALEAARATRSSGPPPALPA